MRPRVIQAPESFRITITGSARAATSRHTITHGLDYLLGRLIRGEMVSEEAIEAYGLAVMIEEDRPGQTVPLPPA
jgi:hypothetical protein